MQQFNEQMELLDPTTINEKGWGFAECLGPDQKAYIFDSAVVICLLQLFISFFIDNQQPDKAWGHPMERHLTKKI